MLLDWKLIISGIFVFFSSNFLEWSLSETTLKLLLEGWTDEGWTDEGVPSEQLDSACQGG